jgi:hypothetical protein
MALTVTAAVPVELRTNDCVAGVFTGTLPNAMLPTLVLNVGMDAFSSRAKLVMLLFALAVMVAVCLDLTAWAIAVKLALAAPAGIVTEAGTVTALLLLASFTFKPPLAAAAFRVTAQLSEPFPVIDSAAQVRLLAVEIPVPPRVITVAPVEELLDELLMREREPESDPAVLGSNVTFKVAVRPGFKVSGKAAPETENPVPLTVAEFTVTGAVPVELRVSVFTEVEPTATLPKDMVPELMLSVGTDASSSRLKVVELLFALAVIMAVCLDLTAWAVAVKLALVDPAGIVMEAGTVTALLLLASFTFKPPLAAAAFSVTAQLSEPFPVIEPAAHVRLLAVEIPVPPRVIIVAPVEELLDELLMREREPESDPAAVGSNVTFKVEVRPGFKVSGKAAPETENPVPLTVAEFTVTGAVPVELRVSVFTEVEPTVTLPKDMLWELMLSVGTVGTLSSNLKVLELLFKVAVSVAVCAELTALTVAVKLALMDPAGTVTVAGIATALMLLLSLTAVPPEGAGEPNVIVQLSVPAPVIAALVQARPPDFNAPALTPVPLRPILIVGLVDELLLIVSVPVSDPTAAGSNFTPSWYVLPAPKVIGKLSASDTEKDLSVRLIAVI